MRVREWMLLIPVVALLECQGCRHSVDDSRSLTPVRRAAVEDGVRRFTATVARDVTEEGPMAWLKHFADSPAFFMAVNGKLVFPNGQAAAQAIPGIARQFKHIELRWGDDLRLDALTENLCIVAASYTEVIELQPDVEGVRGIQSGYFTGLAESLHGEHINLFIERGSPLGPVLEVTVDSVEEAKLRLVKNGCQIIKDEPDFPRCYIRDPLGLIYNLTT